MNGANDIQWKIGDKHPDAPFTKSGVPLTCPECGGMSAQRLGSQSICGPEHAYCPQHDPFERHRIWLENEKRGAWKVDAWTVLECDIDEDITYALAAPGALASFRNGAPRCVCENAYCDHIVAHNARYYNQAPTIEQARRIADAMNDAEAAG